MAWNEEITYTVNTIEDLNFSLHIQHTTLATDQNLPFTLFPLRRDTFYRLDGMSCDKA